MDKLVLSPLVHTWLLDLDGTLVKHNGYKIDEIDTLLDGAKEFLEQIPQDDMVILITSRSNEYKEQTEKFLVEKNIRYDHIIYNAPYGERIVVNDRKPSGLDMALAVNVDRDIFASVKIEVDEVL